MNSKRKIKRKSVFFLLSLSIILHTSVDQQHTKAHSKKQVTVSFAEHELSLTQLNLQFGHTHFTNFK